MASKPPDLGMTVTEKLGVFQDCCAGATGAAAVVRMHAKLGASKATLRSELREVIEALYEITAVAEGIEAELRGPDAESTKQATHPGISGLVDEAST